MAAVTSKKKFSAEDKLNYQSEIKDLKSKLAEKREGVARLEKEMAKESEDLKNYYHIAISSEHLDCVDISCEMSKVSEKYMKKKNDDFLNDSRRTYYKALSEIEDKVTDRFVDTLLHENRGKLATIKFLDPMRVLRLVNKFKSRLDIIIHGFGENSKYKWGFIEMEARYIIIFKNLLDYRRLQINQPGKDPFYPENVQLFNLIKVMLQQVSHKMREKYMIGTKEVVDIKAAINLQEALRKITAVLGTEEECETAKSTIESWKKMLEKEEERKKAVEKKRAKGKSKK